MTAVAAPPTLEETVLRQYRDHLGSGRAAVGQFLGGMAEELSEGAWITDTTGRRYLDMGGYGVFILGHRHPGVVAAVERQLHRHPLATRTLFDPVTAQAAELLASVTPDGLDLVHFVNSGAEATEAAIKLARASGRSKLVTTTRGFHGKTMGALSLTANDVFQAPFRPLLDASVVPYGEVDPLRAILSEHPGEAVVILEPVQGEAGVIVPPAGYLRAVAEACRLHDAMLVVDEIQTGLCRLGTWWGCDAEEVVPDVLLVGKGLSGGVMPVAAMVATREAYAPFAKDPYLHTSTFAGSPLASAAAAAAVTAMIEERTADRARDLGARLLSAIRDACEVAIPGLATVRGRGLLIGVEFADPGLVGEVALQLIENGVIACHSLNSSHVLRFTPPALLDDAQIAYFQHAWTTSLAELTKGT